MGTVPGAAGRLLRRAQTRRLGANGGGVITRTTLPGGLRVVTEAMPGVRSASVGVWVPVGSRDETPSAGRHQPLPRTPAVQGHATSLGARHRERDGRRRRRVQRVHREGAHLLLRDRARPRPAARRRHRRDVVLNATVTAQDVDVERSVVLEEIAMRDDDPADLVHDEFAARAVRRHARSAGRSSAPSIRSPALTRRQIARLLPAPLHAGRDGGVGRRQRRRTPTSCGWSGRRFGDRIDAGAGEPRRRGTPRRCRPAARPSRSRCWPTTPSRRTWCSACRGISRHDPRRFALGVLSSALGGGMSSRLFQRMREERGLAYSVYSFSSMATRTPASSACMPGASRARPTRCSG